MTGFLSSSVGLATGKPVSGLAYSGKFWGWMRIIGGKVADAVVVGRAVRVGFGVGESVGVGLSVGGDVTDVGRNRHRACPQ